MKSSERDSRLSLAMPPQESKRRVRRPKMAEMIAADIRKRIVKRSIAAGSHLPSEVALIEEYGVSRATLREGLRILESEGLIDIGPGSHRGPRVCAPDLQVAARHFSVMLQYLGVDMSDVYAARTAIEPMAAKMAALHPDREQAVVRLQAIVDQERAAMDRDADVSHYAVLFHEALIEASGNATLQLMSGILHEIFEQHVTAVTIAKSNLSPEEAARLKEGGIRAQENLLKLMAAGDGENALLFWQKHMKYLSDAMSSDPRLQRVADLL